MSVVESNSVVESKAMPVLPSAVASSDLRSERAYGTAAVGVRCLGPSKKCSARASSDVGVGKEKTGSYTGFGAASVEGR